MTTILHSKPSLRKTAAAIDRPHMEDGIDARNMEAAAPDQREIQQPLLQGSRSMKRPGTPKEDQQSFLMQKVINQTFQSTAHLSNLLPTGTVLAFQLLSPVFTKQGHCDAAGRYLTSGLIALCGLSCFVSSFTDSVRDAEGNVHYGIATRKGLWVIDAAEPYAFLPPEEAKKFRLILVDFVHAILSILVFTAVVLYDQNAVGCFYPQPTPATAEVLAVLPLAMGVISSMLFVTFPTKRHGIGFPLSSR